MEENGKLTEREWFFACWMMRKNPGVEGCLYSWDGYRCLVCWFLSFGCILGYPHGFALTYWTMSPALPYLVRRENVGFKHAISALHGNVVFTVDRLGWAFDMARNIKLTRKTDWGKYARDQLCGNVVALLSLLFILTYVAVKWIELLVPRAVSVRDWSNPFPIPRFQELQSFHVIVYPVSGYCLPGNVGITMHIISYPRIGIHFRYASQIDLRWHPSPFAKA